MKINRLEELRKIHLEIKDKEDIIGPNEKREEEAKLFAAIVKLIEFSRISRTTGLLELEDVIANISMESEEGFVRHLLQLVCAGEAASVVSGVGFARYYSGLYQDYRALRCLMYLEGALSIQDGELPRVLEEKLMAMLPADLFMSYYLEREKKKL